MKTAKLSSTDKEHSRLSVLLTTKSRGWAQCEADFKTIFFFNPDVNPYTRLQGDYDANKVEMPGVESKMIIGSAPTSETSNREKFWKMVYDTKLDNIFYVEEYKSTGDHFVPWKVGETKDYGKMLVSNKKSAESRRHGKQSVLEILPEGASESVIVRFAQCLKWPETVHRENNKFRELNHPVTFTRLLKEDSGSTMVVCATGRGKSAMFVLFHAAISSLNNTKPIPMQDLLKKLRHDRWGSIETLEQYLTVYLLLIYYIAAKSKPRSDMNELCRQLIKSLIAHPVKK